ncbi:FAD-dependent oxidoreductase [Streptomyces sp. A30]|uniref:FAD-dependent oxidoreductase n=1 Tax=Streptomyces sp. A30 TaxID=2789273 RepID=UPI00398125D2
MNNSKVIVVGAGPVGLITALGLARSGIEVTVLEREPAVVSSPRAMVYHSGVISGIEKLGLLDDALESGFTAGDLDFLVHSTGERISLNISALEGLVPHPYNLHLGQDRLAGIALEHLWRLPGADVRFGTAVTALTQDADGATVTAESGGTPVEFRAGWVVGADGAGSAVRRQLGLELEGMTWPERFVATNIRFDYGRHGFASANMVIDPQYGAIVARITGDGLWRCTFCEDASLPEETVAERIAAYFAETLPGDKDYELVQFSPYRMHQRAAATFRVGRVLLAGDAAHVTNPTGGLGLTSGLFDAFVLSEAMAAVVHGQIGDEVLDRYAEERRRVFLEAASPQASAFKQLVYNSADPAVLEQALTGLRAAAADVDLQRKQMTVSQPLETPSLVARA